MNSDSLEGKQGRVLKACLSDDEIIKTASLLELVWPNSIFTRDYLCWLYRDNPLGPAEAYNVWEAGKIIAHYAAIPIEATLFGSHEKGLLSLNTAVHPAHRGKGYFQILAKETYKNAHTAGFNFVIGVANASSTLLFRRYLRFQLVTPLLVKVGVGKVKKFVIQPEEVQYAQCWSATGIAWRLSRPNANYHIIRSGGVDIVKGATGKYGIWAIMYESKSGVISTTSKPAFNYIRWNPFNVWVGLDPGCDWGRSFYMTLPERFKPSPLNLIFKDLSGEGRTLNPERIYISLFDFDAY